MNLLHCNIDKLHCNIDKRVKGCPFCFGRKLISSYAMYIGTLLRAFAQWRRHRTAIRELAALDDRALSDIGLNRTMIRHAVHAGRSR